LPDSALLFESLLKWGDDAVNHWVGEFAFAFWDGSKQQLLLGRDILGLRPLYFHRGKTFFAFASMPSGLHALEQVPYDFDSEFMAERLTLVPHAGSRSFFKDIERVEPAHIVRVTRDGLQLHRYWRPPTPATPERRPMDYEEGLRSVLEEAVAAQLRGAGDVVASHLSGGLDSSTVTATAARLFPAGKVVAFTAVPRAGFSGRTPPGTVASEADLAAATARLYPNIEHVVVENSGASPLEWLDRSFLYHQQPGANLSNSVWGCSINRAARDRGANTILKGALGNLTMSYAGLELLPFLLAHGRLLKLARHAFQLSRNGVPLLALGAQTLGPFVPRAVWQALRRLGGRSPGPMSYSAVSLARSVELQRKSDARKFDLAGRPRRDPYDNRLWAFSQADGGNSYKGVLAEYGLSVRDPTGDKRVIEYSLATPLEEFVRGGVPRSLARRAFADRLPPEVTGSRVRGYQSADWHEALDRARAEVEQEVASIARCAEAAGVLEYWTSTGSRMPWTHGRRTDGTGLK
jgi:asparagine synthase (glutamine-hydrolysing)